MGLSSNARLLTITARLTSNEYESQQITNAKLRLATQSQQASDDYILALNQDEYTFLTFDNYGNQVNAKLCANTLYQYNDQKNQYVISNATGQALVNYTDAKNFKESGTLINFLKKYGIEPQYKTEDLKKIMETINAYTTESGKTKWENYISNKSKNTDDQDYKNWIDQKEIILTEYREALVEHESRVLENEENGGITRVELEHSQYVLNQKYEDILKYASFGSYIESTYPTSPEVIEYQEYKENLHKLDGILDQLKIDPDDIYTYEDSTKAQWYTNLWYRMNGEMTVKSGQDNYAILNSELASSPTWIKDSLTQGIITIEQASYTNEGKTIPDASKPANMVLNGINWDSKIFSSCPDIIQKDDDSKTAKAEAEYKKKTTEINAKDEKFQRKISLLNTEHSALQTEYESVKSAMDKNIERSFKTFNS